MFMSLFLVNLGELKKRQTAENVRLTRRPRKKRDFLRAMPKNSDSGAEKVRLTCRPTQSNFSIVRQSKQQTNGTSIGKNVIQQYLNGIRNGQATCACSEPAMESQNRILRVHSQKWFRQSHRPVRVVVRDVVVIKHAWHFVFLPLSILALPHLPNEESE
jgi:hypothetical protein